MNCSRSLSILVLFVCSFIKGIIGDRVEIFAPSEPLYIKEGAQMEILCNSSRRTTLIWSRQTPSTSWENVDITPSVGSGFITRSLVEEPSGYVESVLIKKNMSLHDRGSYSCRDETAQNSFTVYATVLYIYASRTTASVDEETVTLHCDISGSDTNYPQMKGVWLHEKDVIPADDSRRVTSLNQDRGRLSLTITHPSADDTGFYNCTFILGTDVGSLVFWGGVQLDGSGYSGHTGSAGVISFNTAIFMFFWIPFILLR